MAQPNVTDIAIRSGMKGKQIAERNLRDDISRGIVGPGQRLVEAELGERYQVTRNSARLAIDALTADGLVERIANVGARVRTISTTEAVEIMECRMVLDGLLCAKAATAATADDLSELTANLDAMRAAVAEGDFVEYSELIQRHHAIVGESSHHPTVVELITRLQAQIVRLQFQLSLRPRRAHESIVELERVVDAISARDAEAAERAGRAHLRGVIDALLSEAAER